MHVCNVHATITCSATHHQTTQVRSANRKRMISQPRTRHAELDFESNNAVIHATHARACNAHVCYAIEKLP